MSIIRIFFLMSLVFFPTESFAEIYKDFLPTDSLATVKEKYQNAQIQPIKAAWLKDGEAFYSLTGIGIVGTIYLKLSTVDNLIKFFIKTNQDKIDASPNSDHAVEFKQNAGYNNYLNLPLDQRLSIDWVRWVPADHNLPMERIVGKYGKPEKCDYDPDTFSPFCSWPQKGVSVNLSDDRKIVYSIEYNFTVQERGGPVSSDDDGKPSKPRK